MSISQLSGYMSYDTKSMDLVSLVHTSRLYPHGSRIHKKIALIILNRRFEPLDLQSCYVCSFQCVYIYICICIRTFTYIHIYIYICTYVHMCICIYVYYWIWLYLYIYIYTVCIYIQYVYIISRGFPFYQVKMLETPQASKDRRLSASKRTRCFAMSRSSQPSPAGSQKWRIIGPWAIASLWRKTNSGIEQDLLPSCSSLLPVPTCKSVDISTCVKFENEDVLRGLTLHLVFDGVKSGVDNLRIWND